MTRPSSWPSDTEGESHGSRYRISDIVANPTRRVTSGPSKKTSYVVVGDNAGESKLKKIKELKLVTLNEDQFLELIGTREGAELDEKAIKAKEKEEKKIEEAAKEMEMREKEEETLRKRKEKAMAGTGVATKYVFFPHLPIRDRRPVPR